MFEKVSKVSYALKAMFDENSAGAILFSFHEKSAQNRVLVTASYFRSLGLPKGNVGSGEDDLDTARREIYEETGISDIEF